MHVIIISGNGEDLHKEILMEILRYYRSLPLEAKAFLSVANREVGLGATLELLAEKAGLPSNLPDSERRALRKLASAWGNPIDI